MKTLTFLCILFLGISTISFSQSKGILKKAADLVEKVNTQIAKGDKSLALSDEQKKKITAVHVERLTALKKLGKDASKEDKKALNKTFFKKINKEILTKEQKKAIKEGKE
ncbi:hypothetical protein H9I45_06025 [Polaribacter haliotis]|uniref:Uncharacterized protein n=1 Tax=Polaribacter haliotis TaxID=1888915 RepID=A0A7L8AJ33_9FLAO|nr:hypothetical protein [Polaribacter haliotis]QOD62000.1 hypothetical protein H9I45_06025 [Polaribacter haliotis]